VKRKGEIDGESDGGRLQRRDVAPLISEKDRHPLNEDGKADEEREIRRRRRFESDQGSAEEKEKNYPNKMAARSSRSSREDKDVTARGIDRFLVQENEIKGNKQPAKRTITTSGSGLENDTEASASGMWISDSAAADIMSGKIDTKRSANSLESIVAALTAITSDHTADYNGEIGGSASGSWVISGSGQGLNTQDDDLPKFFSAAASNSHYLEVGEASSGSGSGMDEGTMAHKQENLISDLAEEVHEDKQPSMKETSRSGAPESDAKPQATRSNETKAIEVHKRDILQQFFGEHEVLSRSRRDQVDKNVEEKITSFFRNTKPDKISNAQPDLPTKHEPPPIPAVNSAKSDSKINEKSGSLESIN
jgi:hypothetical protein